MAITPLPIPTYIPPLPTGISGAPSFNTSQFEISSATDDTAFLFTYPQTGTVTKVAFRTATVTTGATLDVRLETLSSATGDHSGTLQGTNTNASQVVANTDDNTWFEVTLTAGASVTIGEHGALVLDVLSGTPSGLQISCLQDSTMEFPASVENDGTPASLNYMPVMALYYDGVGWVHTDGILPISAITTTTFNNTSTPDIRGNRASFIFDVEVAGFWLWYDADGDVVVRIYGSDGVTVIAEQSIPATYVRSGSSANLYRMYFNTRVTLAKNTDYYIVVKPSSATNCSVFSFSISSTDYAAASFGGENCAMATAKTPTGTGDWTITTTQQVLIGLLVTGFDVGDTPTTLTGLLRSSSGSAY